MLRFSNVSALERTRRALLLGLSAVVLGACGAGSPSQSTTAAKLKGDSLTVAAGLPAATPAPSGNALADLGYRPEADSFAFPNYGGDVPATNLTSVEMRALFGDGVCAAINGSTCDLIPPAQDWMDRRNKGMAGGHCQGMSVTSLLFYKGIIKASDYGAGTVPQLQFGSNDALQRRIAESWAFQALPSVVTATVHGTPNDIVDALSKAFTEKGPMTYGLGIYKRDRSGGHEITPYELVDHGGGKVGILVYDNNYPQVGREVLVDRTANTWTYSASTNPTEASSIYEGDASTNTLEIDPVEPGLGTQPCPFCAATAAAAQVLPFGRLAADPAPAQYDEISLDADPDNHAHLLITDSAGHRLGYAGGTFVNEIPGASTDFAKEDRVWKESEEPLYLVPANIAVTITVDASSLSAADTEAVSVIGPASDVNVDNLDLNPGQKDTIALSADRMQMTYTAGGHESPVVSLGTAGGSADHAFTLKLSSVESGGTVETHLAPESLTLTTSASTGYDFEMLREDSAGEATFKHASISSGAGAGAELQYSGWHQHGDNVPLVSNGQTVQLSDEG